jgi:hypothetical protein
MRRWVIAVAVCGVSFGVWAQQAKSEENCGQMIKESAKYPLQLKETLSAVADSWEQHAQWVGTRTEEAKKESEEMKKISDQMRDMEKQATKLAETMQKADRLQPAEHDMKNVPQALIASMERARDEQRKFGELLVQGAQEMDQQINALKGAGMGVGGSGEEGVGGSGAAGTEQMEPQPTEQEAPPPEGMEEPTEPAPVSPDEPTDSRRGEP